MTNRFYAGQTNYIEEMNALDGETGDHIADTTGAHAATAISNTPAGNIAATTVQAAINELDTEKLSASATTLPASFTASSLTSVGTLTALTTTGSVGIGGAALASTVLRLSKQGTGGTIAFGQDIQTQVQSDVTNSYSSVRSVSSTAATAFTLSQFNHFSAVQGVIGAGSTVTNQMGFEAQSSLTGAANNFGFYSNLASGSGRWNFYAAGTAANYFAGATTFADTLTVSGQSSFAAGSAAAPSVKVGGEQNGLYSSAANTLDVALNGVRQFQFGYTASAVNYLQATGSTTGNETRLRVQGSDTNAGMWVTTKGNGVIRMETGGGEQFRVSHAASAVNYWQAQGAATTGVPVLFATGSDASVSGVYSTKGAGTHAFYTNSTTAPQFFVSHTTSSVNYLQVTGAATGNAVTISAQGSDTNIDFALTTKGTGVLRFGTHSALAAETVTGYITIKDSAGNTRKLAVVS